MKLNTSRYPATVYPAMWSWKLLAAVVCTFGFFKELRPSEAYLSAYLTGPWKNLTEEQVGNEIYPWWTYAYLLWMVPVLLLTDYFRYKPALVVQGLAYMTTWALLLWAQGVTAMRGVEVTYGLVSACDISYMSYLYAVTPVEYFQRISAFTKAAALTGMFVAYLLGQLLTMFDVLDYFQLNIFSFVSVTIAFLISVILPRAIYSELFNPRIYHEKDVGSEDGSKDVREINHTETPEYLANPCAGTGCLNRTKSLIMFLANEIKTIYMNKTILTWSIWWAFASCGNFQVQNYIQNLWLILTPNTFGTEKQNLYNGAVEAAGTLLSSGMVLLIGFLPIDWSVPVRSELLMLVVCALNAVILFCMGTTSSLWVCYILYDVFRTTYQIVLTLAAAQIARNLQRQRYGFVFGCNTFLALLVETILTAIVVDQAGLGVDVQTQFKVYGGYFGVMAVLFTVYVCVNVCKLRERTFNVMETEIPEQKES
ncbi:thiamine transporter 1-like isoform X2 [Dreissena polymorpha]|uniref:Thiamine transporter 2 n=1 Tax=Dreissena polymorpha TaxID=45954 RepID=A0A9D4M623_DREPO|nr:thiamine transporter 1-like isoform X2 [Dreissena polymorpha]KAH3870863.1 hypothetical protein DPMN_034054 [Dreissena polymorpha]